MGRPLGALGVLVTLLLTPGAVPPAGRRRSPAWVAAGLVLAGVGLSIVMASSIESVSYELGGPELMAVTTAGMPGTPK